MAFQFTPFAASSKPARRISKVRYQRTNEALCSGAELATCRDPQILAARWGDAAAKAPSATTTVSTKRFAAVGAKMIESATSAGLIISS